MLLKPRQSGYVSNVSPNGSKWLKNMSLWICWLVVPNENVADSSVMERDESSAEEIALDSSTLSDQDEIDLDKTIIYMMCKYFFD